MVRNRRQSIVEEIASGDHVAVTPEPPLKPQLSHQVSVSKAKSLIDLSIESSEWENSDKLYLDPLDDKTLDIIWRKHGQKYNYQTYLSKEAINAIEDEQMDHLLNFATACDINSNALNDLVTESDNILDKLSKLEIKYYQVTSETAEFDQGLKRLLDIQAEEKARYEQMTSYLKHFTKFDFIAKHLNRSGYRLVVLRSDVFRNEILAVLDDAIKFLNEHPNLKDIDIYKSRFRQCMTRSMTLIKNWLVDEIKSRQDQVVSLASKSKKANPELFVFAEFMSYDYDTFRSWVEEIEKRIPEHAEYEGLLWDVNNQFFKTRLKLIRTIPPFTATDDIPVVQKVQELFNYYNRLVIKELDIYLKYFGTDADQDQLYHYLRTMLDTLFDTIRGMILKETNISELCQLATLLQKYYEFEGEASPTEVNFGALYKSIVEEVQARLIFRIQLYVDNILMKYQPKAEDLQLGRRRSSSTQAEVNILDVDFKENLFESLYLPLGKGLTLLTTIYGLINNAVFDDLAHYIVHACIELLNGHFINLATTHLGALDAKLLYLKNLLLLREQVNNFDIRIVHNDYSIDFTLGLTDIWQTLRQGQFSLNNAGLIEMVQKSVPRVVNNMSDANHEIEMELNNAVNDFIKEASNIVSEPIIDGRDSLDPKAVNSSYKHALITKVPYVYKQLVVFISDPLVRNYLMTNLTNLLVVTYENYYTYLLGHLTDKLLINDLMEVDTMRGFLTELVNEQYEGNQ